MAIKPRRTFLKPNIWAFVLFIAYLTTVPTQAEIFTWVDKDGNKHFGDEIPPEYRAQSESVELDVRVPTSEEVKTAHNQARRLDHWVNTKYREAAVVEVAVEEVPEEKNKFEVPTPPSAEEYAAMSYEDQVAAYEASKRCYAGCAGPPSFNRGQPSYVYSPSGVMYDNSSSSWSGGSRAGCDEMCGVGLRKPRKEGSRVKDRN